MESKKMDNVKVEIKDALTCFICTSKVVDPLMCPQCKRLVCEKCIKKWLDEDHDKCPFCQTYTSIDKMISIPFMNNLSDFFIKEIENKKEDDEKKNNPKNINQIIDEDDIDESSNNNIKNGNEFLSKTHIYSNKYKINEDNDDKEERDDNYNQFSQVKLKGKVCPKHKNDILEYFCLNCNTEHCSKCLLFFNEESKIHQGHKIITFEQRNKFNLEELRKDILDLSNIEEEIKGYKSNIDMEDKIMEKKEEFIKKVIDEFKEFYCKKSDAKKFELDLKNQLIKNQIDKINNIRNSYTESINNFLLREDENGFKEYLQTVKGFKDTNRYKYSNKFEVTLIPNMKIYETDFIDIDINENEEIIGEMYFNLEGIEKPLHFRLNGEAIDEVLINLLIELDNDLAKENEAYYGFLLIKKDAFITSISLEEKMIHDKTLILGRTLIRSGLNTIVENHNKCHVKLIIAHFNI